jgi:hypothetical protein
VTRPDLLGADQSTSSDHVRYSAASRKYVALTMNGPPDLAPEREPALADNFRALAGRNAHAPQREVHVAER